MPKFAVFSGFLGSGKTSTMTALTEYYSKNYGGAAMITNDLGSKGLADARYASLRGCMSREISGDCICYKNEELADTLRELYAEGAELVFSDIPGFGVGALEHVYHGLAEKFPGEFELAPFTVLVEPNTIGRLKSGEDDLAYILHTQLIEAELIVLNKCDTLDEKERLEAESWLRGNYPGAELVCISALSGENMDALAKALRNNVSSMHRPDIGYGGEEFSKVMGRVCEYNIQYYARVCCETFDGNEYLLSLAKAVEEAVRSAGAEMPHMKLLAWQPEGDYAKADMLGAGRPAELYRAFCTPCRELALVLNSSAFGDAALIDEHVTKAVEKVSEDFMLELIVYKKELI